MRASLPTDHPIDAYSTQVIQDGLLACYPEAHATFVYPQPLDVPLAVDLQLLGALRSDAGKFEPGLGPRGGGGLLGHGQSPY